MVAVEVEGYGSGRWAWLAVKKLEYHTYISGVKIDVLATILGKCQKTGCEQWYS